MEAYERLEEHFEKIKRLGAVLAVLRWDKAAMMPEGGAEARSEQMAALQGVRHQLLTEPRLGEWLKAAEDDGVDGEWEEANLREMRHRWMHAACVPAELVHQRTRATSRCEMVWRTAREDDDFDRLAPYLEEVVELTREVAEIKAEAFGTTPYDALVDQFEPGMTAEKIEELFDDLAEFLPGFIEQVLDHQGRRSAPLELQGPFGEDRQKWLAESLMEAWCFDFNRGRLDTSHHPFCGGYSDDVRLTTNYRPDDFLFATMAVLHETGHGLYNQGLPAQWSGQMVGNPRGMAFHESQSLFVEMQIGRSLAFARWVAPMYREAFDVGGEAWTAENLHRVTTRVKRSLIRVSADEVTYPAHVILRHRLETALISGDLRVAELPEAFADGMEELVGIRPDDDRNGCMQDIHWMIGSFGYFPTYTLGAMIAAQLYAAVERDVGDVDSLVEHGRFAEILNWLRDRVHSKGSLLKTEELLEEATGEALNPDHFKAHLRARYLDG